MAPWLGIDTGGTFTDFVWCVPELGRFERAKVPSDPADPAGVVRQGMAALRAQLGDADRIVYGTTLVTNAVLEEKWARVAAITSRGYRDLVEIGRQNRFEMYNFKTLKPAPISPRRWRLEIGERTLWDGSVAELPDDEEIDAICRRLRAEDVDAIAVCFLFSFVNGENERRVADRLRECDGWYVTASSDVGQQAREYERFATAVLNAAVGPLVSRVVDRLAEFLSESGVARERLFLIGASGGTMTWERSRSSPVNLINSGPAGGVQGALEAARESGLDDLITYDMGGTSTDICLVKGREPAITGDAYVNRRPVAVPQLDLSTIGAGGGSIAWAGPGGEFNVGPASAGADPGPACYGRGGTAPTVTDASLILGRLRPDRELAGSIRLDVGAAEKAVATLREAFPDMSTLALAEGIVRIAVAKTTRAIREVSVARGHDPRDFTLFAYGGAGPMYATEVAAELDIPRVVVPLAPGNFSALGLIVSDLRYDFVRSRFVKVAELDLNCYRGIFRDLECEATAKLRADGFSTEEIRLARFADMRYAGQWFEVSVPQKHHESSVEDIDHRFRQLHQERYGVDMERPTEFVNFRVSAYGMVPKPQLRSLAAAAAEGGAERTRARAVFGGEAVELPVYDRERLAAGAGVTGPAIVEEFGATTVVSPGWTAEVESADSLILTREAA